MVEVKDEKPTIKELDGFTFYNPNLAIAITKEGHRQILISSAQIACFNAEVDWSEENVKAAIVAIVEMLKGVDDEIGKDTHVHNRDNIKVSFVERGFAKCSPFVGELEFGPNVITNDLTPLSFGYQREKRFMEKRIKSRVHGLIWLILHEYCHLFKNRIEHRISFYEFVDSKFKKYFENF